MIAAWGCRMDPLPPPETAVGKGILSPQTPIERTICAVFEEVLGTKGVGVEQSFFELGGHSFLAVRAQALLEQQIGKSIKVTALYQYPSASALAEYIASFGCETACNVGEVISQRQL